MAKKTKTKTDVLAVIDASGSMHDVAADVRGGFNQYMQDLVADTDNVYSVTLSFFNTTITRICEPTKPSSVPVLTAANYRPRGGTALLDAIGDIVSEHPIDTEHKVLVLVHTDGEENSSHEWRKRELQALIADRKERGWAFVFLGAGPDVWRQGAGLGMNSVQTVQTNGGTRGLYHGMSANTVAYASGASGEEVARGIQVASVEGDASGF